MPLPRFIFLFMLLTLAQAGYATDNLPFRILSTSDGGFLVTGAAVLSGGSQLDVYVYKLDSAGEYLWGFLYGGSQNDNGKLSIELADGGFMLAGYTRSFGQGGEDLYVLRLDAEGHLIWSRTYGGLLDDRVNGIWKRNSGNFLLYGSSNSAGTEDQDLLLVEIDSLGTLQWAKVYGGSGNENCFDLIENSANELFLTGFTTSAGAGNQDAFLLKTDDTGSPLNTLLFGGITDENLLSLTSNSSGKLSLGGWTESFGAGLKDIFLVQLTADWSEIHSFTLGNGIHQKINRLFIDSTNRLVMAGYSQSYTGSFDDRIVIALDSNGIEQSALTFPATENEYFSDIIELPDSFLVLGGQKLTSGIGWSINLLTTNLMGKGCPQRNWEYVLTEVEITITDTLLASNTIVFEVDSGAITTEIEDALLPFQVCLDMEVGRDEFQYYSTYTVSPSPWQQGELTIRSRTGMHEVVIEILDINGSIFSQNIYSTMNGEIHLQADKKPSIPGVYFIRIKDSQGNHMEKVLVF